MKKLLLGSVAIIGMAAAAAPASAEGLSLDVGGHFKGYVTWINQDTTAANDERSFDILKETEVHFSGETTLDNGLTVGVHIEAEADGGQDTFDVDESYAYFSGAWGRVNFGDEDGAAYLLQVAAPSADSNFDGIRQFVNPVNYTLSSLNGTNFANRIAADGLDYDNAATDKSEKLTYLTPVMNGLQLGVSYTPDVNAGSVVTQTLAGSSRSLNGVHSDDVAGAFGSAYEVAARYEGQFDEVGFTLGGGYTNISLETDNAVEDDFQEWNIGVDLDWSAFGVGAVYTENNSGLDTTDSNETWVLGADYTTGPFKFGISYLNNNTDVNGAASEVDTDRWTGGVVYTYGPGMTFRGSISYLNHEVENAADADATSVLLGTQINF